MDFLYQFLYSNRKNPHNYDESHHEPQGRLSEPPVIIIVKYFPSV